MYTYWNAPIQQLLRDVSAVCTAPNWLCNSAWIRQRLLKRDFISVRAVENDITRIVTCRSFKFPAEGMPPDVAYDPSKALVYLAESFPQCISINDDWSTVGFVVKLKRNNLTGVRRNGDDLVYLCDCPKPLVDGFK
jgi:hypothetical protein